MTFAWKSSEMSSKRKKKGRKKSRKVLFVTLKKPSITFLMKIFKPHSCNVFAGYVPFQGQNIIYLRKSYTFKWLTT